MHATKGYKYNISKIYGSPDLPTYPPQLHSFLPPSRGWKEHVHSTILGLPLNISFAWSKPNTTSSVPSGWDPLPTIPIYQESPKLHTSRRPIFAGEETSPQTSFRLPWISHLHGRNSANFHILRVWESIPIRNPRHYRLQTRRRHPLQTPGVCSVQLWYGRGKKIKQVGLHLESTHRRTELAKWVAVWVFVEMPSPPSHLLKAFTITWDTSIE